MTRRYFKVGLRPVYFEEINDEEFVFVFDWNNGSFKDDFTYYKRLFFGPDMDDTEEISESEFNTYVEKLKKEKGLI
jgi:hypothetical protein